ncbi:glycosyltransferase family 2 protein, partial [Myxococcota bacterium]|nr:glycosyltransferase family 2 protein [Myxococcota bacterium]
MESPEKTSDYDTQPPDIGIVIPAYNESKGILPTIERLRAALADAPFTWELLIVDDGSSDDTYEKVKEMDLRIVRHDRNRGYGAALKTGLRSIRSPWFAIIDADGTYPEEELVRIAENREQYDMIIGSRTGQSVHIPLIRRPAKAFMRKLASYVAGIPIPDLNSGLRIMRREVVEKYVHLLPDGFSFTTTISLAMLTDGYRVKYEDINYLHREGKSKIRPIYDTLNFISLILRMAIYFKPLKFFI